MTLPPTSTKNQNEEPSHVDRFRNPGRGKGDPRESPPMGAGRMHSRGEGTGHKTARRSAGQAADQSARERLVVSVHPPGIWRHGPRSAPQRAGADGTWRDVARRAVAD